MSIVSYAQNFEDVMLWRALGHIPKGFYIDVGAQDPVVDSLSKAFYEHGWRGIHVEATHVYASRLRADRTDELVLQAAVNDSPGSITFYEIPDTGLSTGDSEIAEHHRSRGYTVRETAVQCITLADVFAHAGQRDVHWLKIDVEGMEPRVLAGWGDSLVRPWVVVVESTYPNSQVETHQEWEGMLLARGYTFTYFDGLSRYYVLADRPDLAQKLTTPPNIFDGFSLAPSVPYNGPARELIQQKEQSHQDELASERANATLELQTVRETLSQREDALGEHISQLQHQIAIASEQQTEALAARDTEAAQQIETLRQQHTGEVQHNEAKERELNTSMQQLLHQAEQEKTQLVNSHNEEEQALRRQHTKREQAIAGQLQTSEDERHRLQQERKEREQALLAQTSQAKQEVEDLLRTQAQREQAIAEKLEAVRNQAAQESAELARTLVEQQHALHGQHIAHEQALNQRIEAAQEQCRQLQQESSKREQTLLEQSNQAKREVENLLRTQVQREREISAQLLAVQQQTAREKTELARGHAEKVRELGSQQAQREKALTQQLHAHQQELRNLQKDRIKREHKAAEEKAELTHRHNKQEHALLRQQAERERTHSQQLLTQQEELRRLQLEQSKREQALLEAHAKTRQQLEALRDTLVQREQEMLAQLLASQQQAAQDNAELRHKQREQEQDLHRQYTEREAALAQQLQALRQLLQRQQDDWAQLGQALKHEIATLQNETQTLHQAQQLQAQQHGLALSTKLDEHTRLLEACAALEAQLQAEVQSGQRASQHLRQLLAEVQHSLEVTHTSLSWRMTAPLRKLAGLFISNKNQTPPPISFSESITPEPGMQVAAEPPLTVNHASRKPTMPPPAQATPLNMPTIASTLPELLAYYDQHFVECAYRTLLGRAPDLEGLGYYLGMLRAGFSKTRVLAQLRLSAEGKVHAAKLPGLDKAIQRDQRGRQPLIGWLFRLLDGTEGNHPTERKLRGIENQLGLLSDESSRRFNQMEAALAGLHHLFMQQNQSIVAALDGAPMITPNDLNISPIHPPEPDGLKQLSPRAREIYSRLKSATAIHARRAK